MPLTVNQLISMFISVQWKSQPPPQRLLKLWQTTWLSIHFVVVLFSFWAGPTGSLQDLWIGSEEIWRHSRIYSCLRWLLIASQWSVCLWSLCIFYSSLLILFKNGEYMHRVLYALYSLSRPALSFVMCGAAYLRVIVVHVTFAAPDPHSRFFCFVLAFWFVFG